METETEVEEKSRKGGLRTMPFIIVNESFERLSSYGLEPNMIIYLMTVYRMSAATGSSILEIWNAFSNGLAILGAIIADSYLGRFRVIAIGSFFTLTGVIILWLTAMIPQLRSLPCSQFQHVCNRTTTVQLAVLFSSFGFISLGAGFIRPCSIIFGADQLEKKENPENQRLIESYFNWTTGLLQAVVAAFRKRNTCLPFTDCDNCYYRLHESELLAPSNDFRSLNRACMIRDAQRDLNPDGSASNPWSLCSVEQVESLKAVLRVLPMWSTGIMIFLTTRQFSFSVLQAKTMDRHIFPQFEVPAASFSVFMVIAVTIWIIFYDRVLVPLLSKYTERPRGLSAVIRMGIGLIVSYMSMALSAITESIRRQRAIEEGHEDNPSALVNMSAMWLVPQYALLGVAQAVHSVGHIEFFYSLLPKSMSSIASAMSTIGTAVSCLAASVFVSGVDWFSSTGGKTSWLSSNINRGHLDYYFWLLTFLCLLNFLYFLVVCRFYKPGNDEISRLSQEVEEKECDYRLLPES